MKGFEVGSFTVRGVFPHLDTNFVEDREIQIGCHRILMSEAKAVLGPYLKPNLTLVAG